MTEWTKNFIDRSHFYEFNAKRVDLNVCLVYNYDQLFELEQEHVLIWKDHAGIVVPLKDLENVVDVLPEEYKMAYRYLLDCLKDTDEKIRKNLNHFIVIGFRKECLHNDITTVCERIWCCDYEVTPEGELRMLEPVLDVFNKPI